MNILKEFNTTEKELLENIGIVIEDRNYSADETDKMQNSIIDDILCRSSKNGDIQRANKEYSEILNKIENLKNRE